MFGNLHVLELDTLFLFNLDRDQNIDIVGKMLIFFASENNLCPRCLPSKFSPLTPSLSLWMQLFITG